jgi:FtsP/CotA-like multicopper oxidase with cupredoxin domain
MNKRKFLIFTCLMLAVVVLSWGIDQAWAQPKDPKPKNKVMEKRLQQQALQAAAKAARARGVKPGVAGLTAYTAATPLLGIEGPGGIPHYFGPYGNWAFSPLPQGPVAAVTLDVGGGGTGYTADVTLNILDVYGTGSLATVKIATVDAAGAITSFGTLVGGSNYTAPFVDFSTAGGTGAAATATLNPATVTGGLPKFVDSLPGIPGVTSYNPAFVTWGATTEYALGVVTNGTGYVQGVTTAGTSNASFPTWETTIGGTTTDGGITWTNMGPLGSNNLGQYIPAGVPTDCTYSGQVADCYSIALVEYSEKLSSNLPATRLRGYVQVSTTGTIPLYYLKADGTPDTTKPIYYPNTTTQVMAVDKPHYLGPVLVAKGRVAGIPNTNPSDPGYPKPVRIRFYNLLPSGTGGDLFIPVDETVPGSGLGPALPGTAGSKYTQNRATVHLHGNNTVWISDGNTHQWITPADEVTPYPKGVSARNVPDMLVNGVPECDAFPAGKNSSGCQTFFYTNAQSARLQFYHDHAMGITRVNVYAGEAAGYVITDAVEKDLINGTNFSGVNINCTDGSDIDALLPLPVAGNSPGECASVLPGLGIPLVIQDKTFVDANTVFAQDPTWNWGTKAKTNGVITAANTGDLWYPHVYMTVQNPWDLTGTNAFGRWFYGPWFNPPTPVCVDGLPVGCIEVGVVPNEYADPANPGYSPSEPPMRPGVPNPSIPGESFLDTQLVNGTVYPYVEVPAGPVRLRILNASNDRALNLQLYKAFDKAGFKFGTGATDPSTAKDACGGILTDCTEVKMVPVSVLPANQYADTVSGIPDPATAGPPWIQIGTEGGFMPAPVEVPQLPIGFNPNVGQFNVGIVNQHSLYLLPAERADVIVDFTGKSGQTFILYNDAPAPVPAGAAVYDFYTGDGDQTGSGGPPSTLPGYGPNTRTIMQIRVNGAGAGAPDYSLANLQTVWKKNGTKRGVFEVSQDPTIIPQAAYQTAYNTTLPLPSDASQFVLDVGAFSKTFQPLQYSGGTWSQNPIPVTIPFEMKAMHDEMGGVYDTMFGRMSGMLGLTNPNSALGFILPFPFSSPPTDVVKGSLEATQIGTLADGTQLWRIFHNGVDTHPIHVHMFTAQLINRVGQDGQVAQDTLPVDPSDVGWKETFKVNPLEITFLALRPTIPTVSQLPFEVPDSERLIDPTLPEGATLPPPAPAGWFDPEGLPITEILNHTVNFGWEYVWHCHILSHEEMDFMHSLVGAMPPWAPPTLTATLAPGSKVDLAWDDRSIKEFRYRIERATNDAFTTGLATFFATNAAPTTTGPMTFVDTPPKDAKYWYRVIAEGFPVGETFVYPGSLGFPTETANAAPVNASAPNFPITVGTPPTAPSAPLAGTVTAVAQAGPSVNVTWRDTANNETNFLIQRCDAAAGAAVCSGAYVQIAVAPPKNGTGNTSFVDATVAYGSSYLYQVAATNSAFTSSPTALQTAVTVPALPPAPTSLTVAAAKAGGNNYTATLNWAAAANPTNFTVQRATNASFTTGLNSTNYAGNLRTATQTITKNTTYYYRIKANNAIGGSSTWTNALPFPIRTGP